MTDSYGVFTPLFAPANKDTLGVMAEVVLEINNLTRRFGTFTAVDHLTLSVDAGEVFGLLGSNGAAKTTTIKMLTTLLPPTSGEGQEAGFPIISQSVGVRRAIGYFLVLRPSPETRRGHFSAGARCRSSASPPNCLYRKHSAIRSNRGQLGDSEHTAHRLPIHCRKTGRVRITAWSHQ